MGDPLVLATSLFLAFGKLLLVSLVLVLFPLLGLDRRRSIPLPESCGQRAAELRAAWIIPVDGALFWWLQAAGWLRPAPSTWGASVGTFVVLILGFETWFYLSHRALHTRLLWPLHREHHLSRVTGPLSSLRFSFPDKLGLSLGSLGLAALLSHVLPITLPGLLAFFVVYYGASVAGHSNVELFPAWVARSWSGRVFCTPTFHALHHVRPNGHYGLMSPLLDRLLGTAFRDYLDVQARAAAGQASASRVRGAVPPAQGGAA